MSESSKASTFDELQENRLKDFLEEKESFEKHCDDTYSSIKSQNQSINESNKLIVIGKNDNMKSRIDQIQRELDNGFVLLASRSNGIPKMVSIAEIVKQKTKVAVQYNKVSKFNSYLHPSHKQTVEKSTEEQILEQIRGRKTYNVQVMYIMLAKKGIENNMVGWTVQKTD